jgi:hypothetical protein
VNPLEEISVRLSEQAFDFDESQMKIYDHQQEIETFRMIDWNDLSEDCVTLPIDKIIVKMLKSKS